MRRFIAVLLLLVFAMVSAGCAGARETDETAYVLIVGLDKADVPDKYKVTFQIATPRALAGGSGQGGKGSAESTEIITYKTVSVAEALNLLNTTVDRSINLSHNKAFVIGDKLAREGLDAVVAPIKRYREWRGSMFVLVVNEDTAENFIRKNKQLLELIPSRYYESLLLTANLSGYYPYSNFHELYTRMKSNSAAPYAALCGINYEKEGEGRPSVKKHSPGIADEYKAGLDPQKAGDVNPVSVIGTAVFRGDKLAGTLTSVETRMMSMLEGQFRRGFITVEDPLVQGKVVNLNIRLGRRPKLTADFVNGQAVLAADVLIEAEYTSIASGTAYEQDQYRQLMEEQVSILIQEDMLRMLKKTQAMGSDVVGFGYPIRTKFRTYDEFRQMDWAEVYKSADIRVNVKTKIRRTGLLWRTLPII